MSRLRKISNITKKKKIGIIIVLVLVLAIIFMGYSYLKHQDAIDNIVIEDVDMKNIPDGVYTGSCDAVFVTAEVEVTVKDHKITAINLLEHRNGKGEMAEILPAKIIENQTLKVDTVTGATSSSKVIIKAIENALTGVQAQHI